MCWFQFLQCHEIRRTVSPSWLIIRSHCFIVKDNTSFTMYCVNFYLLGHLFSLRWDNKPSDPLVKMFETLTAVVPRPKSHCALLVHKNKRKRSVPHSTKCPDGVFVWISARDSISIGAIVEWAWKKEEVIRKGKEAVQTHGTVWVLCGYCGVRPLVSLSRVHLYFFSSSWCSALLVFSFSPHFHFPCPLLPFSFPVLSSPLFATWAKYFPAVTLVTGPYRVELRIVYERDEERKKRAWQCPK